MKEKTVVQKRAWLNPISSCDTGAISTELHVNSYSVSCDVQIRDCSRQIDLNFDVYAGKTKEYRERKKKLKLLIDLFQELYDNFDEAFELHCEMRKEVEEKHKAQKAKK